MPAGSGELLELTVERLAAGGDGVARSPDGVTVFVPLAAPGDRLRVRVTETRRRYRRAEIVEVLAPGAARVPPRCAAFGRCGGCAWQHLDYAAQLDAKRAILADALQRIGGHTLDRRPDIVPSPEPYGYRMRARVLARRGTVGYRARRSHELCATSECPVLAPGLLAALDEVRERTASRREFSEWEIGLGSDGAVHVAESGAPPVTSDPSSAILEVGADALLLSPGTFSQANGLLWDALHERVVEAAGRGERVLELYAGAGFFTLGLARRFGRVVAVESSRSAAADLRGNLSRAGIRDVDVIEAAVERVVPRRIDTRPDVVVLDPPRAGLPEPVCRGIADLTPRRIVYLSCDPATLARDTARLVAHGYALERTEGFDLFPQTAHLEALAVLERRAGAAAG